MWCQPLQRQQSPPLKRVNGPPADLSECRERLIRFCYSIALLATARKSVNSSSRSFFSFAATLHMCVVPSAAARIFTSKPRDWFLSGSREEITIISIFQAINSDCLLRCFVSLLNVKREEEKKLLNIKNEKERKWEIYRVCWQFCTMSIKNVTSPFMIRFGDNPFFGRSSHRLAHPPNLGRGYHPFYWDNFLFWKTSCSTELPVHTHPSVCV